MTIRGRRQRRRNNRPLQQVPEPAAVRSQGGWELSVNPWAGAVILAALAVLAVVLFVPSDEPLARTVSLIKAMF